jgi:uncharacterized acetyltransferase MJ1064
MKKQGKLFNLEKRIYKFLMSANQETIPKKFRKWLATYYPDARVRKKYLETIGVEIGEGSYANLGFMIIPNNNSEKKLFIGKNVSIAPNVVCVCGSNANNGKEINTYPYIMDVLTKDETIHIEDEVWIGANVTILPGVTIGRCSVIGAGSVVSKDVEPYSIYAGVPARKIRDIKTGDKSNG